MPQHTKKRILLLLIGLLLVNIAQTAVSATQITGPRAKNLKIYSSPSSKAQVIGDKKPKLSFPIKIEKRKGGWLKISHKDNAYWVQKFQVKTDKINVNIVGN